MKKVETRTAKVGRPAKPKKEKHSLYFCIRLKPDQYRYLVQVAKQLNTTPATYVRTRLFSSVSTL